MDDEVEEEVDVLVVAVVAVVVVVVVAVVVLAPLRRPRSSQPTANRGVAGPKLPPGEAAAAAATASASASDVGRREWPWGCVALLAGSRQGVSAGPDQHVGPANSSTPKLKDSAAAAAAALPHRRGGACCGCCHSGGGGGVIRIAFVWPARGWYWHAGRSLVPGCGCAMLPTCKAPLQLKLCRYVLVTAGVLCFST